VLGDPPPCRAIIGQNEEPGGGAGLPASLAGDLRPQPDLAIEVPDHRLKVRDRGLDLDDEQRPRCSVERDDVDRTALAPYVERYLCPHLPARSAEPADRDFDQARMGRVEEPVERLALIGEPHRDGRTESCCDSLDGKDRDAIGRTSLDPLDRRPGGAAFPGEPLERPAAPSSQRTQSLPEPNGVHMRTIADGPSLAITAGGPSTVTSARLPGIRQISRQVPIRDERDHGCHGARFLTHARPEGIRRRSLDEFPPRGQVSEIRAW